MKTQFLKQNHGQPNRQHGSIHIVGPVPKNEVSESAKINSEFFAVGNLKLDRVDEKALIGDRVISLTQKEFDILEFLMRHAGEIVSRQQILENIWGKEASAESNMIDAHIKNLRRKLKFKNTPKIETQRSSGYRIIE